MSEPPVVAILTVTTNAARHLPGYLDALERVSYGRRRLWVVDNASDDGSAEMVAQRAPEATVLRNESNLGFTGACNRGIEAIMGDGAAAFVLFLNDDTEVEPGFLEPLVAMADGRTLVAPKTYLAGTDRRLDDSVGEFDWWRGTWKRRVHGRREGAEYRSAHEIETANLSALVVPVEVFRAIGGLDEAFFVYYDDTDFCRRAREAGFRIMFEPESVVHHLKGATLGGQHSGFGCYYLARNRPYLVRKHVGRGPRFWVFLGYYLATRVARCVLWSARGRWDLVRATWQGLWDFARGRMGKQGAPI
ncbi:MAG: glycosyltransferase family 2 protein [Dehalococcoidia bacterium]